MNWYYESAGKQNGPVSESELDRLLAEGKVTPDTLVWREGLAGWAAMRTVRPAPSSIPQAAAASPEPVSPGAEAPPPGYIRCTLTGKYVPPSEVVYIEGKPYSAEAKPRVMQSLQDGGVLPTSGLDRTGPAWEQRAQLGIFKAIVETVKAVLMTPGAAFAGMKRTGGLGSPILFWLLTGGIAVAVSQVYGLLFQGAMTGIGAAQGAQNPQAATIMAFQTAIGGFGIIIAPALYLVYIFLYAGLSHLCLMMVKGANHDFETTFRTYCFAVGSAGVISLVPICGGIVGGVWGLVAYCIGLAKAHDTTGGKGAAGALLPMLACCVLVAGIFAVIAVSIGAAASAAGAGR